MFAGIVVVICVYDVFDVKYLFAKSSYEIVDKAIS